MDSEELKARTKEFAHRCVKFAVTLPKSALGNTIRTQLIRSATSTAANYRAACLAQSKAAFSSKISITLEECDESWFWIEFAVDEEIISLKRAKPLLAEAEELTRIFAASRRTASRK